MSTTAHSEWRAEGGDNGKKRTDIIGIVIVYGSMYCFKKEKSIRLLKGIRVVSKQLTV